MSIDFAGKVAVVTGAGGGLGRAYALELAQRGARVVVNDLGGARDGRDGAAGGSDAALTVVEEIRTAGGTAMGNGGDVADFPQMEAMVAQAVAQWGGVHILVNNAGILRDKTFAKMSPQDFEAVIRVHLIGSAFATKAVWNVMREQAYGRVLFTTSSSGLGGNFGQANYAAAKMGLVGLAKTLHMEGAKYNIRVNALAPTAGTRMTQDIFPEAAYDAFQPEAVVPAALFLVSEAAPSNVIVGAGGGVFQSFFVTTSPCVLLPGDDCSVEGFAASWPRIASRAGDRPFHAGFDQAQRAMEVLTEAQEK